MAEYQRFVAYVYEYQKGRKGRNCGFVRVEAKDTKCVLEVHLLCPGLLSKVRCDIFGFVRNQGLMDGSLLGSCVTRESRADCLIETERAFMGDGGISLDQMGGIILMTENGAFFGTEWDDLPVRPENFRRIKRMPEPERSGEEKKGELEEEKPEETGEEEEKEPRGEEEKTEETGKEREQEPEGELEKSEETAQEPEDSIENREISSQSVAAEEKILTVNFGEEFTPFDDGEIVGCRKIRPGDFRYLHPRDRALCNNRFLQYGFYNFGHLLLGRTESGRYLLGVPGGYDQQERFMAGMFGFPFFKQSGKLPMEKKNGGYWYRLINPPELH